METIEIRLNKKTLIPMLLLLVIALVGGIYYIYFSGKFDDNNRIKLIYLFVTGLMLYGFYIPARKFLKKEPVLVLTKDSIEINEKGRPVTFHWLQIREWDIKNDDGTRYLIIDTGEVKKKVNISWLDKTPAEIESLMTQFKGAKK
jgi:hypothetical protein